MLNFLKSVGKRKDVLVSLYPDAQPAEQILHTLIGKFGDMPELNNSFLNINSATIMIEES